MQIGPYEIRSVITGTFRLDGGAMFGTVPKVLWQSKVDVDAHNRILLAMRSLLAVDRRAGRAILVDSGCGDKWTPQLIERFEFRLRSGAIEDALRSLGAQAITDVIVTHLHFDHNGGLTQWRDDARKTTRLRFPNARHWLHKRQWDHAHAPTLKDRASYIREDFGILDDSGKLELLDGDAPPSPFPHVSWFVSHGHTPYQLHPIFADGAKPLMFLGDVVPTAAHLSPAWVMAYDLLPVTTIEEKLEVFRRVEAEGLLLAFAHDPNLPGVAVTLESGQAVIQKTLDL